MADGTLAPPDMWAVPRALRGEAVTNAEYTLRRKDTGETWVGYYSFAPIHDATGAIIGSVVVARDITYRKRIEEDLRRTSDLLRAIIKYSPDIIFAKDCQCRLVHASDSLLRLLDKKPEEVLGKTDAEIYADPKVGEAIMENDRIVRETGLPLVVEERAELPDGTFRTFRSTKVPWLSEDGSLLGTFGIAVDINELKAKEQELSKAREDAERANNAKSLFLAAASHDLRQPLQALNLYFDVLAERLPPKDAPLMKPIRSCLDSLNELLTDLLDLSKLDAGVVAPNISDFPLADILQKIATAYAPQAEAKGIRIRVGSSKFWVRTDPVLLERIVGNLVANAVRYTEHGGVVIGCRRRDGKTWVEVTDTGIGIPKNKQSEIFEEFRQLGNDARNREKGSGLGLAIVKKTVDVLGLEIKVMSKLRQGSTFALAIPLGEPADNLVPHAACENRSLRIAVLEDAVDVREALTLALDQCGHSVVAAASSAELMTRLGDLAPQVILADYRLGDETGLDGIVLVRKAFGNEIPAIILTGDTDPEVVRGIAAHDIQLKHKPLKFDALQECLKKLASKTRQ
jgi:PAS domain S-box-containing protein